MSIRDDLIRKKEEYAAAGTAGSAAAPAAASQSGDIRAALLAKREQYANETKAPAASVLPGIADAALSTAPGSGAAKGMPDLADAVQRQKEQRTKNDYLRLLDEARATREREQETEDGTNGAAGSAQPPQTFLGAIWDTIKNAPQLIAEGIQAKAKAEADMAADDVIDPLEAAGLGLAEGMGTLSAAEALGALAGKITGNEDVQTRARDASDITDRLLGAAKEQNALAYRAGGLAGDLALMSAVGEGMGAVKGLGKLPAIARGAISGFGTLAGTAAVHGAGAAAAGKITPGEYAKNVGLSGLAGAAGGAISAGVNAAGLKLLRGLNKANNGVITAGSDLIGLQNKVLPNVLMGGVSSLGYSAGVTGTQELSKAISDENYTPDWKQIGSDALTAFAFGAFNAYLRSAQVSEANRSTMQQINDVLQEKYKAWSEAADPAVKAQYAEETAAWAEEGIRSLAKLQIVGADQQVRDMADFLWNIEKEMAAYASLNTDFGTGLGTGGTIVPGTGGPVATGVRPVQASTPAEAVPPALPSMEGTTDGTPGENVPGREKLQETQNAAPEGTESRTLAEAALEKAQAGRKVNALDIGRMAAANAAQVASEESEGRAFTDAQDDNAGERIVTSPLAPRNDSEEEGLSGKRGRQIAASTENEAARAAENVTLTAEDRAAEVRRVAVEEAGLSTEDGDTLADIFIQTAPEGVDPAAFAAVNGYFYQAGERGLPFDKVRESIPAGTWRAAMGTEEIAQYAYNRGRMKTLAQEAEAERRQREAERKAAEQAQLQREAERNRRLAASEAGLHEDDFTRANLSAADARRIDETARLLGTPVYVVGNNEIGAGRAQGELAGGRAVLLEQGLFEGENAGTSAGLRIAGHEWGHRLKRMAPTEYGQVVEALRPLLTKEIEQKRHLYNEQNGLNYNDAELTEEAVNDRLGDMLKDGRILDEFIEEHRQERGLLQRMWEVIKSLVRKLTGAEKRAAQSAEAKLRKALDAAATAARQESSESRVQSSEGTENAAQEGGEGAGSEFSLKEDSEGRELTEAQAAYFADSKALDEDGRLLVMYQGSNADFTVFDRKKSSYSNLYGRGFYFTDSKEHAGQYGSARPYYLNIVHPLLPGQQTITKKQMRAFLKAVAQNEDDYDFVNYGQDATVDSVLNAVFGKGDFEMLQDVSATAIGDLVAATELFNEVNGTEYDGFILPTETVVFRSNQAKRTDNLSPTGDPDIRYSLKEPDAATMEDLRRENERLRARVEYWRGQTKQTRGLHLRYGDLSRLTGQLVKDYGAELDEGQTAALEESLRRLGRIMREDPKGLQYSEMLAHAEEIARELVQNARELVNDDEYRDYRDLRKWLRGQKLTISRSDAAGIADFNEWKKAHSAIRVGYDNGGLPIDTAYAELAEQFPGFFPEEIDNPTDQLERIGEILDSVGPVYENPYSPYMAEAIEEAGYDVLERIMDEDTVRPAAPTRADKQAAKYEARLDAKDEQIKDLRERYTWNVAQRVAQERAKRDSMIAAIKGHQAEVREKERNRRQESRERDLLLRVGRRLAKLKTTEANRAVIYELIGDLDLVSKGLTTVSIKNLVKLRELYEGKTTEGSDNYDPDFIADKNTLDRLRRLEQRHIEDFTITEVRELREVLLNIEHAIRTAKKLIDSEDRRDTYFQALDIVNHMKDNKGWKKGVISGMLSPERFARRVTGYAEGDPLQRAMSGLSAGQRTMWDYQRRALQDVSRWTGNREFMRRWSGKDARRITIQGKSPVGLSVEASVTPGMLASLYLHSLNDDNLRHIAKGGVTIPSWERYVKGDTENAWLRGATKMVLQRSEIRRLVEDNLTPEEMAFTRAIYRYFNETSKAALGETAEKLLGYSPFNVDNYFPISVNPNFLHTDFDSMADDGSIKETLADPGYAQERRQDSKPIMLYDANDVLERAIRKHGQYVGLAIPVRNVNKLIKTSLGTMQEDGTVVRGTDSIKETLQDVYGKRGLDYLTKLMQDVQGGRGSENSVIGDLLARMRSNYAGAVLTLNAGVAIKQAASFPTAAAVLDYRHLARALKYMAPGVNVDTGLIQRYTPLLWYRSLGYSSQEQGELQNRGRPIPKKLNWIQAMDVKTTAALWKAAEYQIAAERRDLQRGSDAFYKAVAELYNRVIEETQPNYAVMQRPEILRTKNELTKTLNMFKTQPFQNFNILYDAIGDYQAQRRAYAAAANDEARAEVKTRVDAAKRKLGRALSSQLLSSFVFALMQFAWDAFRRKDDKYKDKEGNVTPGAWLKGIGVNMLGNGVGMVPFGSEALDLMESITDKLLKASGEDPFFEQQFYGFDASVLESMTDLANSAASMIVKTYQTVVAALDSEKQADWEALGRQSYDTAETVAEMLGLPVGNVRKTLTAVAERVLIRALGPYMGAYQAQKITTSTTSSDFAKGSYDILWRARNNDSDAYKELYERMVADGIDEGKIKDNFEDRMKKAEGVDKVSDLSQRYMSPEQQSRYDGLHKGLERSSLWRQASGEERERVEDKLYQLVAETTTENSAGTKLQEKIDAAKKAGISESEYVLYMLALSMADEPNSNGNYGSYTNDEQEAALDMLDGLSREDKSWLWMSTHDSDKNNPYK